MLFSNLSLEISLNKRGERVLELCTLYNNCISMQIDRGLNKAITYVGNRFHNKLSLKEFVPGKFRLVNKEDNDIYIILDTLDYKIFNQSAAVNMITDNFEILRDFHMSSRNTKIKWNIMVLKVKDVNRETPSILEYITTCGDKKYIVIDKGRLHHLNLFTFKNYYSAEYLKQTQEKEELIKQCI